MGSDVHAFLEVKVEGQWHHFGEIGISRNYEIFERMAGVRGEESKALVPPRGFPKDASRVTRLHHAQWGSAGHTHSWLDVREMEALDGWRCRQQKKELKDYDSVFSGDRHTGAFYLFGNDVSDWWRYPKGRHPEVEDLRLVFWFDN